MLKIFIYRSYKRIKSFFTANAPLSYSGVSFYIENGNIMVGKNCNIDQLSITIYGAEKGFPNITIGDDCYLMGNLVLYQSKAEVFIGNRTFIGPNTTFFCCKKIEILNDVMISWGCTLIDTNAHSIKSEERLDDVVAWKKGWQYKDWSKVESHSIRVEERCWVGFNSIVSKGVTLMVGSIVAAGSVVTKSTPPFTVIGGNPAVVIKQTV